MLYISASSSTQHPKEVQLTLSAWSARTCFSDLHTEQLLQLEQRCLQHQANLSWIQQLLCNCATNLTTSLMCFRSVNDDNNTKADAGFSGVWPLLAFWNTKHYKTTPYRTIPYHPVCWHRCGGSICFRLRNRKALFWPSPSWNSAILLTANAQHVRHRFEERNNYNNL